MTTVRVCGGRNQPTKGVGIVVNTTSKAGWSSGLSPFLIGPCNLPSGDVALNVENAWQYSKVYSGQTDAKGNPSDGWWIWARRGWKSTIAVRYPMGRGTSPLYSFWDAKHLGYIEARKKIYIPLYRAAVINTKAFSDLKKIYDDPKTGTLWLWDYDGYDHIKRKMTYQDVINETTLKMGHAFILAMLLENVDIDALIK